MKSAFKALHPKLHIIRKIDCGIHIVHRLFLGSRGSVKGEIIVNNTDRKTKSKILAILLCIAVFASMLSFNIDADAKVKNPRAKKPYLVSKTYTSIKVKTNPSKVKMGNKLKKAKYYVFYLYKGSKLIDIKYTNYRTCRFVGLSKGTKYSVRVKAGRTGTVRKGNTFIYSDWYNKKSYRRYITTKKPATPVKPAEPTPVPDEYEYGWDYVKTIRFNDGSPVCSEVNGVETYYMPTDSGRLSINDKIDSLISKYPNAEAPFLLVKVQDWISKVNSTCDCWDSSTNVVAAAKILKDKGFDIKGAYFQGGPYGYQQISTSKNNLRFGYSKVSESIESVFEKNPTTKVWFPLRSITAMAAIDSGSAYAHHPDVLSPASHAGAVVQFADSQFRYDYGGGDGYAVRYQNISPINVGGINSYMTFEIYANDKGYLTTQPFYFEDEFPAEYQSLFTPGGNFYNGIPGIQYMIGDSVPSLKVFLEQMATELGTDLRED